MRRSLKVLLSSAAALVLVAGLTGAWALGPTLGIALAQRPLFLLPPSPERYASTVLEMADRSALHADSPEYAAARAKALEVARTAGSTAEVHAALDAALKAAGGKHSGIVDAEKRARYSKLTPAQDPSVEVAGGVLTATVPEFDGFTGNVQKYADALGKGLDTALRGGACGAIVDLRGNGGGDMGPMVAGLSPLLPDGTALEFAARTHSTPVTVSGGAVSGGGTPTKVEGVGTYIVPTAVLVDAGTASSGEAAAIAFKGLPNTRFFGRSTAGYASANLAFEMPDKALVMITVANDRDRAGEEYGDSPLVPDEESDDALTAARAWLASEHSCH